MFRFTVAVSTLVICAVAVGQARHRQTIGPSEMSEATRTQLRMAFFAVDDLRPIEPGFQERDEAAQAEVRKAKAMADSRLERLTIENIETALIAQESCHLVPAGEYVGCESNADSNREQIVTALHLRKQDAK